jgi:ABC-type multidrug transport system permease subunit
VIGHYFFRRRERRNLAFLANFLSPVIGFGVCLWIWLSVSSLAMKVGAVWSLAGVVYLFVLIGRRGARLDGVSTQS